MCQAFDNTCTKCDRVGHFTKQCKPPGGAASQKLSQYHLETQHLSITHNRVTPNIVFDKLNTWNHKKINATLRYEEFNHNLGKYVDNKPAVDPKFQVSIFHKFGPKGEEIIAEEKETMDQIPMQATTAVKLVSAKPDQISVRDNTKEWDKLVTTDPPESMPLPATITNIPALVWWIKNHLKSSDGTKQSHGAKP